MTAVNVNALGSIGQITQPVAAKTDSAPVKKSDFGQLMKDKVAGTGSEERLKSEEAIKTPAKRTEVKSDGMSRAKKSPESDVKKTQKSLDPLETSDEILEGAAQILNVPVEELKAIMNTLEMDAGDLADRNNVAQLILTLNGSNDISDMLVDNGMLETFNSLNSFIEETLLESGFDTDSFRAAMENLSALQETTVAPDVRDDVPVQERKLMSHGQETSTETEKGTVDFEENVISDESVAKHPQEPDITVTDNRDSSESDAKPDSSTIREPARTDMREGQTATVAENFIRNLEMAAEQVTESTETQTDFREIVYQVVQKIRVQLNPDSSSLEMRLNPENLGRVSISIISKAGAMTAQINTENRQAKEAIESSLQILKESIEAKGIKVEAVEVRISDFNMADSRNSENSANEGNEAGRRSGRRGNILFGNDEIETDEAGSEEILNPESTVSYRA